MRVLIQRVSTCSVTINEITTSKIKQGLLILLGIETNDTIDDINYLCNKIIQLRIFNDENEKMNLSIQDINGEIMLVSQFTLFASTKKGNRPSFIRAAKPEIAIPLYKKCIETLEQNLPNKIQTGTFGADMKIELLNDGPVTLYIDSKQKE